MCPKTSSSDHPHHRHDRRRSVRGRVRAVLRSLGACVRGKEQTGRFKAVAVFRRVRVRRDRGQVRAARVHVVQLRIR